MLCEVKNISKTLKDTLVLDNVSLTINKGEIIGIVGHNGSGKTMLLRAICGLILPDEGEILYSKDVTFGVVIEEPGFMNECTALENLEYLASINKKITKKQILEILDIVGLKDRADKKVRTYSLGMKKKLGIAQAIMEEQNCILLDEPFNALDEESVEKFKNILKQYVNDNRSIILVSHHANEINDLCSKVYKMNEGKLRNTANE